MLKTIKRNFQTKGRGEESCQVIGTPRSIRLYTTRLPNYIVNTMPNSISVLSLVNTTQSCIPQTAKPNWFKLNGRLLLIDYMHRSYYDCKINVPLIDYMHRSYYDCKINVSWKCCKRIRRKRREHISPPSFLFPVLCFAYQILVLSRNMETKITKWKTKEKITKRKRKKNYKTAKMY